MERLLPSITESALTANCTVGLAWATVMVVDVLPDVVAVMPLSWAVMLLEFNCSSKL